jgi:hypothetical protein
MTAFHAKSPITIGVVNMSQKWRERDALFAKNRIEPPKFTL